MEIILLQDVKSLGREGDAVEVKDGYARNFLIPKKLGVPLSTTAVKVVEEKRKKTARAVQKEKKSAEEVAKKLSQISLTIPVESGMDDVLFGSVTPDTIFHALQQEGVNVDKKCIVISGPIKKLGIYNVEVKLYPEVKGNLRVWVVKK